MEFTYLLLLCLTQNIFCSRLYSSWDYKELSDQHKLMDKNDESHLKVRNQIPDKVFSSAILRANMNIIGNLLNLKYGQGDKRKTD